MRTALRYSVALPLACSLLFFSPARSHAQAAHPTDPKVDAKTVAEVDAGLGPCTADFVITDEVGKPVYAANIRVHIAYGFMNLHKFDLQVGTNADGKARFIGLPENSKQGFFFRASDSDREGSAFDDPSKTCKAQFTIVLRKKPQE
ncbi:MAG: hypothetical protein WB523_15805 [Candidatus Sulfotelmatobacter sp.]